MTRHEEAVNGAADQKEVVWLFHTRSLAISRQLRGGLATQAAAPQTPSPPRRSGGAHTAAPDDLIATLNDDDERRKDMQVLEYLGFTYETSRAILRYWDALELDAPTGGPYGLLGAALAAIAELGEPETRGCRGGGGGGGGGAGLGTMSQSRFEWYLAFAQVLNTEALAAIHSGGAYMVSNFAEAKRLAYNMITGRWDRLAGRRDAI